MASSFAFGYALAEFIGSILAIIGLGYLVYVVGTRILLNKHPQAKYKRQMTMIKLATLFWCTIIFESILKITLLMDFMIPFPEACDDGSCVQCSIAGRIKISVLLVRSTVALLLFYEIYNIYGKVRAPKCILVVKLWLLLLITIKVIAIISVIWSGEFSTKTKLSGGQTYSICMWDNFGVGKSGHIGLIASSINFVAHFITIVLFTLSFVIQTYKTLLYTKTYQQTGAKLHQLESIINIVIRHSILSTLFFLVLILRIIFWAIGWGGQMDNAVIDCLCGFVIYMFFTFGTVTYNVSFGRLHRAIFKRWKKRHKLRFPPTTTVTDSTTAVTPKAHYLNSITDTYQTYGTEEAEDIPTFTLSNKWDDSSLFSMKHTDSRILSNECDDSVLSNQRDDHDSVLGSKWADSTLEIKSEKI
eukprot:189775_1